MPGPLVIRDPTPSWLKPQNASVFDSWSTRMLRLIGRAIGATDPQSQAMGVATAPLAPEEEVSAGVKFLEEKFPKVAEYIRAFHGSPHDFEKFDVSKIGTGEGAQAYGHGLYFAENQQVAQDYKTRLSGQAGIIPGNSVARTKWMVNGIPQPEGIAGHRALDTAQDIQGLLYYRKAGYPDMAQMSQQNIENRIARWRAENPGTGIADSDMRELADFYEKHVKPATADMISERPPGKMYEVAIYASPDQFLDWDKPLSQHPQEVQDAVNAAYKSMTGRSPQWASWAKGVDAYKALDAGRMSAGVDSPVAAQALQRAGIPGIKYLDQGSRSAGEGTRNYVVFDDKLVDILKKYGIAATTIPPAMMGASQMQQQKSQPTGPAVPQP